MCVCVYVCVSTSAERRTAECVTLSHREERERERERAPHCSPPQWTQHSTTVAVPFLWHGAWLTDWTLPARVWWIIRFPPPPSSYSAPAKKNRREESRGERPTPSGPGTVGFLCVCVGRGEREREREREGPQQHYITLDGPLGGMQSLVAGGGGGNGPNFFLLYMRATPHSTRANKRRCRWQAKRPFLGLA